MRQDDLRQLYYAKNILENQGLASRIAAAVGMPIEGVFNRLPEKWSERIQIITRKSLKHALDAALLTMNRGEIKSANNRTHKLAAAVSGGLGGALGMAALAIELPVTTVIMFRSIADIARSEGEDIGAIGAELACLEVFALGGKAQSDNSVETGYFAVRALLAYEISEAAKYLAGRGLAEKSVPALARFVSAIASRFSPVVAQKVAASCVPIIGALGGALINTIFMNHCQDMARGHFIIRRLERIYGQEEVKKQYAES